MPRILGVMMTRDQWPLVGVAVLHALEHVDHLVVVDHKSTDGTSGGLAELAVSRPDRITLLRSEVEGFVQASTVAMARAQCPAEHFDWIYAVDADEFLLPPPGQSLRSVLAAVPQEFEAVRYELHNWLAPHDVDAERAGDLVRIRHRAVPSLAVPYAGELLHHELFNGNLTLFDVDFDSKVLVRTSVSDPLAAGAHSVDAVQQPLTYVARPDELLVAHVPMWTRDRLEARAEHGAALRVAGYPVGHGWQSQAVADVIAAGGGDEFWARHSIGPDDSVPEAVEAVPDERLSDVLLAYVAEVDAVDVAQLASPRVEPSLTGFDDAVGVVEAIRQTDAASMEELRVAIDEIHTDRVRIAQEYRVLSDAHQDLVELFEATELNRAFLEAQLEAVRRTWSWRIVAPLRTLRTRFGRRT